MLKRLNRILWVSLLPVLLAGCVTQYHPAPVIYVDPLAQAPVEGEGGLHSEVLPYADFPEDYAGASDVASAEYYPWWSLDYFYLGHGYGSSGFSVGFSPGYPYHDYYYYPPFNRGWYGPVHVHHHHYYHWYRPYRHHYWHQRYREQHYADHRERRRDPVALTDPGAGRSHDREDQIRDNRSHNQLEQPISVAYRELTPQPPRRVSQPVTSSSKQKSNRKGKEFLGVDNSGDVNSSKALSSFSTDVRVISQSPGYARKSKQSKELTKPSQPVLRVPGSGSVSYIPVDRTANETPVRSPRTSQVGQKSGKPAKLTLPVQQYQPVQARPSPGQGAATKPSYSQLKPAATSYQPRSTAIKNSPGASNRSRSSLSNSRSNSGSRSSSGRPLRSPGTSASPQSRER